MFSAVSKGERRNLRGSARLSSKMSGRLSRLRALRPRSQQQRVRTTVIADATRRLEANLKEMTTSHEEKEEDTTAKKCDVMRTEKGTIADIANTVSEMDDNDDDDELTMITAEEAEEVIQDDIVINSKETTNFETSQQDSYECKSCKPSKTLPNMTAYLEHLQKEHKGKNGHSPVENHCPACSYVALNVKDLENHQRLHHLKRKFFRCAKCDYVTHIRARYTKHVKYHSMPMIKCDACDFSSAYKWNLERHMRNHGGGGAFKCRACNFTADIRQSLTVHESYHHDPPVGQVSRKSNKFERKPRNSPKRYNQVGASDFREVLNKTGNTTNTADSFIDYSLISIDDKKSALASAECIALKCEEQSCQFITAWDSEMQRHLAESHMQSKPKKPLPSLIPLNIASSKPNNTNSGLSSTLLKVPRVRVRPELAQIARDTELAKIYGNKQATHSKRDLNTAADMFERKNASFFDKLKEKLTTSTSINNGVPEVAVSNVNDLKCWCTFKASSMEELACHKQTHHTALSVSVGTTRCLKCRRRCKSTSDLQVHMQCCHLRNSSSSIDNSLDKVTNCSDICMTSYSGEHASPQMDWDVNFRRPKSLESSVEGASIHPGGRRVFKCPHCPFWASTASRFHVHIVGHLNRKPFECSMCAYRSNWRWDITKHIKLKAARDAVHMTARVLMTDETGRRNYSKYNKYLAQVEQQSWDEDHMEERSIREANSDEPPTKVVIVDKEYSPTVDHSSQSSITILSSNEPNQNSRNVNVNLRPPPPLKAAVKSRGQSLLRNNPITMHTASDTGAIAISTVTDENKRTQWKCKRCNYRDCNKENVLLHVKSHYESTDQQFTEGKNPFGCSDCPFSASDAATLSLHRIHHRPNLEAIFKCYLCPYYVSTKAELLDHVRLHGEELAAIHKQNIDFESSSKCKLQMSVSGGGVSCSKDETTLTEQIIQITSRNNVTLASKSVGVPPPPPSLLLDTRALPDVPMVWVSRPNGILSKMLKCRHCPYVSSRRAEVRDHEIMHVDTPTQTPSIACTDCSFICWHRDIMIAHTEMHAGSLGTVHCLVDETRPDVQQASDLATLLGMTHTPMLGTEPDLEESRLVHCCGKCPARFLCEKELRIHLRYHSTELAYSCQWCTYAARQTTHLQAHQKAHSTEYQERTKYLLSAYGFSQRYPPPATACVEAEIQEDNDGMSNVAWIVVEMNDNTNNSYSSTSISLSSVQRTGNSQQVFTCAKCPARYFKLDALEYHMTLHGSNNRFKCNDCDYSSKTAQNLVKHQVVHRRHNETSEATASSSVMTVPSSASISAASPLHPPPDPQFGIFMRGNPNFVYPGYLRNGRLKEKRYKCHKCPSAFEKREQYRVHLTLHGAKQRYRCNMCDYSVKYYANYIQHVKKHQANAQAQASRRQFEDDRISIDNDSIADVTMLSSRSSKSLRSPAVNGIVTFSGNNASGGVNACSSNQDKQTLLLMQKKGVISLTDDADANTIRCQSCPFSTSDKDAMDMHKRRHGIDRMTPPCPYCDYIPRKDENVNEHIQLHFTRLYKPESYLIVELLTLTMEKVSSNSKENKNDSQRIKEILFKECADGRFLPLTEPNSLSLGTSAIVNTLKEKIIVDPNTGETKHHLVV